MIARRKEISKDTPKEGVTGTITSDTIRTQKSARYAHARRVQKNHDYS